MINSFKQLFAGSFLAVLASAQPLMAGAYTPRVDAREVNQQQRINQGVISGALTPREANTLKAQQNRIERVENAVKADGVVTKGERLRLNHRQNQASKAIFRKKHNWRY